jgi:hypothetical protein
VLASGARSRWFESSRAHGGSGFGEVNSTVPYSEIKIASPNRSGAATIATMMRSKAHAYAVGSRSAVDISGMTTLIKGPFADRCWDNMDAESTVAYGFGRVMALFGLSARCGRDAIATRQDIDALPEGCTNGAVPRKLPLRHVTATHTAIRR